MVEPPCRGRRRAAADAGRASAAAAAGAPEGAQGGQPVGAQGPRALRKLIEDLQPSQRILSERQLARRLHLQSRTLAISNAQWHHMLGTGQRQRWAQQRWQRRLSINAGVGAWQTPCCTDDADDRVRIAPMLKLCSSLDACCTSFQYTIFVLPRRRRLWR